MPVDYANLRSNLRRVTPTQTPSAQPAPNYLEQARANLRKAETKTINNTFANVRNYEVTDATGRKFNWTQLRNKNIYLTGHGQFEYKDGFCRVPAGTTIYFYQNLDSIFLGPKIRDLILGTKWTPHRIYTAGQSCPNMTLLDDDQNWIDYTDTAICDRVNKDAVLRDHYNFNCNQFSGLPLLGGTGKFSDKHVLKLEQLFSVLHGNTLHWCCCQVIYGQNYIPSPTLPDSPFSSAELASFSPTVREAIEASISLSFMIRLGQNDTKEVRSISSSHLAGTFVRYDANHPSPGGSISLRPLPIQPKEPRIPKSFAEDWGVNKKKMPMGPAGLCRAWANGLNTRTEEDVDRVMQLLMKISIGLLAIRSEAQGDGTIIQEAESLLQRKLLAAGHFLKILQSSINRSRLST